jgi:uroporphyrinogen III methyltransferase/synthase
VTEPLVYLVGAGPGHPGFLTMRAVECLGRADLVIYDKLVQPRVLEYARAGAERMCVNELAEHHVDRCGQVHDAMIAAARAGKRVVRLKGGDPFVFGRGGEEAEVLREAGIAFEVVPGVTAGIGAAACAGIPLTHRAFASGFAVVTGHENPSKPRSTIDWAVMARFPGTVVVYMGIAHLPRIVQTLLEHGKSADTPAAAVHWATTGDQRTVIAKLSELPAAVQRSGLTAPAVLIIGEVVSLREHLSWFERRPLFGARILVTRPRHQSGELLRRLEELGAVTFVLPAVEVRPLSDWSRVDRAVAELGRYQWLVFTSANGVAALLGRLRQLGKDMRALGGVKLAAIGPATADALREYHLEPDLVPDEFCSESLASALKSVAAGQRVLLARADRGRELLREELATVAEVEQVAVYSQVDAQLTDDPIFDWLRRGEIDYVTLTSSNIARAFVRALDAPCLARLESGEVGLVTISPVTSAAVRELGLPVAVEAKEYTAEGLVQALMRHHATRPHRHG